jgi:hypothetical protein
MRFSGSDPAWRIERVVYGSQASAPSTCAASRGCATPITVAGRPLIRTDVPTSPGSAPN